MQSGSQQLRTAMFALLKSMDGSMVDPGKVIHQILTAPYLYINRSKLDQFRQMSSGHQAILSWWSTGLHPISWWRVRQIRACWNAWPEEQEPSANRPTNMISTSLTLSSSYKGPIRMTPGSNAESQIFWCFERVPSWELPGRRFGVLCRKNVPGPSFPL